MDTAEEGGGWGQRREQGREGGRNQAGSDRQMDREVRGRRGREDREQCWWDSPRTLSFVWPSTLICVCGHVHMWCVCTCVQCTCVVCDVCSVCMWVVCLCAHMWEDGGLSTFPAPGSV